MRVDVDFLFYLFTMNKIKNHHKMETIKMLLKVAFAVWATTSVIQTVFSKKNRILFLKIWKNVRVTMFFECMGVILIVISAWYGLSYIPFLSYGWTSLIYDNPSNIGIGSVTQLSQTLSHSTTGITSIGFAVITPLFFLLLFFCLPSFAHTEEKIFRKNTTGWGLITIKSILFGLIHCIVGVSLSVGFALAIGGFFFAMKYRQKHLAIQEIMINSLEMHNLIENNPGIQTSDIYFVNAVDEGVMRSTTYHTVYNSILVFLGFILSIVALWM